MNNRLADIAREELKNGLSQCTEFEQILFKRMYSHKNLETPINDVVDNMDEEKLDWALTQVGQTLKKRLK